MRHFTTRWTGLKGFLATLLTLSLWSAGGQAADLPGKGVTVQPLQSSIAEETFQTLLVVKALERLGYDVKPIKEVEYATAHIAIGNGDGTFLADHWDPLHVDFYTKAGGADKIYREGVYSPGALQGYLIDKKTADQYQITHIDQLKDPKLAKLFDTNGDGKADLAGCNPGWGCEKVIEHQLDAFKLRDTVTHNQGSYSAIIADTITRFKKGEPVLYYTWTPYWVSGVMVPGKDVVWLQVPFSSLPGERKDVDTTLPSGQNYGFQANNQRIIANLKFAQENPAAAKLFSIMEISANDISAQNLRMRDGEKSMADIERHTDAWIKGHQETFDSWIQEALKAAKSQS
ncbi:glycine betaine/L-proline ABC transporter substrate-binding protein ProX [Candidatus Competibacter phosphatis]|jgi:glycine betaine/proline transport system substrate-binding protein|uniref:Glycine betaine/L-proline ABC transporter substrate-binding protein ProX n=1 Tax=Candidatus Competibacter phosphatis TaxID=221280 RepID=A0ABX1TRS3_9GAMM|nr:glycine betaine/L-proline ABC transporter substrate-binding protein ProX [Candidatus Competibacter phosphatis]NMQ20684.1 glycine betaine/L-proline ABC transporter substrate-binding protein ProX [Candidatus Competibacter phosphatis]